MADSTRSSPATSDDADLEAVSWVDLDELNPSATPSSQSQQQQGSSHKQTLTLTETAFLASAGALVWLINYYFPLGPVLRVFFSVPVALIFLRRGMRAAWMGALVTTLLLTVLMGPARSIIFLMPYGLLGLQLGWHWRRGDSWYVSVALGALLGSIGFFFRVWLFSILIGDDLWLYALNQMTGVAEKILDFFGILAQPSLWFVQTLAILGVLMNSVFYLVAVHLVALLIFERLGNRLPPPPRWVANLLGL